MKFESAAEIHDSPETVWAALSHPEEWPKWTKSLKKIERLSTGPLAVGSSICVTAKSGMVTVKLLMTIKEFVPGQRVVMQGKILGTGLTRYYTLEPRGQSTRVTAGGEASGLLSWLVSRGGQALSDEIVQSFKEKIEGQVST